MDEAAPLSRSNQSGALTRRTFVKDVGITALAASLPLSGSQAVLGESASSASEAKDKGRGRGGSETPITRLFRSLDDRQRRWLCFPFDHPFRTRFENHWAVVEPRIRDLNSDQRALCHVIFKNLCQDESHGRLLRQMDEDYGGFENYHVALFGEPNTAEPFEWVLTGRHNTLRADGHRHEGVGFNGPLFFGHGAGAPSSHATQPGGNIWWHLAEQARVIFKSLDEYQQAQAFVPSPRRGVPHDASGLSVAYLDDAQKQLVQHLLSALVRSFRGFDAEEIQGCLRTPNDADRLRLSFASSSLHPQQAGMTWKLEGPAFAWCFHGDPHVHSWLKLARTMPNV